MIVDVHKYLIFGSYKEIDRFFSLAQKGGFLEFIGTAHKRALELPEAAKILLSAIKIAKRHFVHPREAPPIPMGAEKLSEMMVALNSEKEKLFEEERLLSLEIAKVAVFGDFSRKELDQLEVETKRTFQFFCMRSDLAQEIALPAELIFVGRDYDLDHFVSIQKEKVQYPKMIEIQIERPVGVLRERLFQVKEELAKIESEIRAFSNALPLLQRGLEECLDEHHLRLAKHDAAIALNGSLFAVETWVPKTRVKALQSLISNLDVSCELIAIEPKDIVPTYMENKGIGKVGEDLVHLYDIPAHTDKDPSSWVLIFFPFFFAIIISDAGYGLIYLLFSLVLKWKIPRLEGAGKRFIKLMLVVSSSCILWGVATSSYFGMEIGPDNPLRKTSFLHYLATRKAEYHMRVKDDVYEEHLKTYPAIVSATDGHDFLVKAVKGGKFEALEEFYDNILMEFSFLVGIVHLSLSFCRYLFRNWAGLGWIVFMIGGYLFFPVVLNATTIANFMGWVSKPLASTLGSQMAIGGVAFAFLITLIQKGWMAFHELLNVIQVFTDVLSYLRLYALALGGMVMARTFNDHLGIDLGLLSGALVVFFGHFINITISIMGGVIHGLRLNFLEWYRYSFEGGGRLFNPLRLRRRTH